MRQRTAGRPRSVPRRIRILRRLVGGLAVVALAGGGAVVSTATGTSAAWSDRGAAEHTTSSAGALALSLVGFSTVGGQLTIDSLARTGSLTITNTGSISGTASTTVALASGSSAAMAQASRVTVWSVGTAAECTAMAVPSNAMTGTWAAFPAITANLAPGASYVGCVRSRVPGTQLATTASVAPVVTAELAYGGSPWRVTAQTSTTVGTTASSTAVPTYASRVVADGAVHYWPLGESSGQTAFDWVADDDMRIAGTTHGTAGAIAGSSGTASTFGGTPACAAAQLPETTSSELTVEAWFKTTSTTGGKIVGFGSSNSPTNMSVSHDRHIYMSPSGIVHFGVYPGQIRTVDSPTALNDGAWHHVVGTIGTAGMVLYVDGVAVASRTDTTTSEGFGGYWRIGCDWNWDGAPYFNGAIDEVAIYSSAISADTARAHYRIGADAVIPAFTTTASDFRIAFDASASAAGSSVRSYAWDFGDGTTGTGMNPTKRYDSAGDRTVVLTVTSNLGTVRTVSQVVQVRDTTAPARPAAPTMTMLGSTKVTVNWTSVTDGADGSGVVGYKLFRNGIDTGWQTNGSFTDASLIRNTNYSYTVVAYDAAGNSSTSPATAVRTHPFGDRYVRLRSVHTGLCLNIASAANNTPLTQTTCGASNDVAGAQTGQLWHFIQVANGSYELAPAIATGQRLDVYGLSTANGGGLTSWTSTNQNNQRFLPVLKPGSTTDYRITIPFNGLCVDLPGATNSQTQQITQWSCNGEAWQDWTISDSTLGY